MPLDENNPRPARGLRGALDHLAPPLQRSGRTVWRGGARFIDGADTLGQGGGRHGRPRTRAGDGTKKVTG